jgi:hypothetical protein
MSEYQKGFAVGLVLVFGSDMANLYEIALQLGITHNEFIAIITRSGVA